MVVSSFNKSYNACAPTAGNNTSVMCKETLRAVFAIIAATTTTSAIIPTPSAMATCVRRWGNNSRDRGHFQGSTGGHRAALMNTQTTPPADPNLPCLSRTDLPPPLPPLSPWRLLPATPPRPRRPRPRTCFMSLRLHLATIARASPALVAPTD